VKGTNGRPCGHRPTRYNQSNLPHHGPPMPPSTTINTKLIDSLTQIILSLTEEERALLGVKVQHPDLSETELQAKYADLQRQIAIGVAQMQQGEYSEYDDASLPGLLETIRNRGQQRLNQDQPA
jgi:sugar diacid utilization regulator